MKPTLTFLRSSSTLKGGCVLSGLLAMGVLAMPAHAFDLSFFGGAQDEVRLRPVEDWHAEGAQGVIAFTTFTREQQAMAGLPCKWTGRSGVDDHDYGRTNPNRAGQYDFLCKGGNWGTVSLMLDRGLGQSEGISRVRLLWREWPQKVQAGQGDREVAAAFLNHVIDRFVPLDQGDAVRTAFFKTRARTWWSGRVLKVAYTADDNRTHIVHRLEITGLSKQLSNPASLLAAGQGARATTAAATPIYEQQPVVIAPSGMPVGQLPSMQLPAPATQGLTKPQAQTQMQVPNMPGSGVRTIFDNVPTATPAGATGLTVPTTPAQPAPVVQPVTGTLLPATAADIAPLPEPDSLKLPPAPPRVSDSMVPNPADQVWGRAAAPSNFDMYNRAEALTRDFETKARPGANDGAKIVPSGSSGGLSGRVPPVQGASGLAVSSTTPVVSGSVPSILPQPMMRPVPVDVTPTGAPGPSLSPVATPAVGENTPREGLSIKDVSPVVAPAASSPTLAPTLAPGWVQMDDPSPELTGSGRPLPQLKFVPKAQPLGRPDEVIRFEDENSQL